MAQRRDNPDEAFGSDSFLDIVANMVGILIILVILAGLQAKGVPQDIYRAALAIADEIRQLGSGSLALKQETLRLEQETRAVEAARAARTLELAPLSDAEAELEAELARRRQALDARAQEQFDLRRQRSELTTRLSQVALDMEEVSQHKPVVARIESYPTPLSQTVQGQEIHYQLRGGRITHVPLEALLAEFKDQARQRASRLRDQNETTDTVGPIEGFRMRYTLERVDIPVQVGSSGVMSGSFARLEEFTLIPESSAIGETLEQSLEPDSRFRATLAKSAPQRTTVTLWTYPDSFALYRAVKRNLYLQGFTVAGRPLPEGQPIGGSPSGSKSAAQ